MRQLPYRAAALAAIAIAVPAVAGGAASAQLPASFPAPARIAFTADDDVYTIGADGSERRRLTTATDTTSNNDPAWAPDSSSISFVRRTFFLDADHDDVVHAQVWLMRPDGSDRRRLTPVTRDVSDSSPAWAPDGGRIAFARSRLSGRNLVTSIVVMAADGGGPRTLVRRVSDGNSAVVSPVWSADGRRVIYALSSLDRVGLGTSSVYSVALEGGKPKLLARDAAEPSPSPDGASIAFTTTRDGKGEDCSSDECNSAGEIYVMNANGTGQTRLTKSRAHDASPDWSADGQRIVFSSNRNYPSGDRAELYSMRPDGSCLTWLTNGSADSGLPAWERGPGLSTDPGACGPIPRPPLVDLDLSRIEAFDDFPLYWLGRETSEGLLLTVADALDVGPFFQYDDCGRYEPAGCSEPLSVSDEDACDWGPILYGDPAHGGRLALVHGGLLDRDPYEEGEQAALYTGRTVVLFEDVSGSRAGRVAEDLREVSAGGSEPEALPPPRLPTSYWHRLERVTSSYRRLNDVGAVAQRLHLSRGEVKRRLSAARRLRTLGITGRIKC